MERKKKILYVITKSNWGGAQRYVYDLATNLPKEKFYPIVILGGEGELGVKLEEKNINIIKIDRLTRDINFFDDLLVFFKLIKIFKKERPDVIHLNSSKISGLGALAGRLTSVPKIIFTVHGWPFNESRPYIQKILIKFASWLTVLLSHLTITVSEKDFHDSPLFIIKSKLRLIHNGIVAQEIEGGNRARELLGIKEISPRESVVIGTIAELHRNKGILYAIKAMERLSRDAINASFVIVGEGEDRKKIEELIIIKNLSKSVFLLGEKKNAGRLAGAFDIFLLPSIKEGLPYVLLEAGMAGLPVVATEVGGTPEIIDHMKNGILVPAKDTEAIARAIKFLIDNPEKRKEFGEKLKEKVGKEFKLETMVEKTLAMYSENWN